MIGSGVDDVKISLQKFGMPDYVVFVLMLISCSLIGIYFGFIQKKSKKSSDEESDYLVGGRQMQVVPITMSLIARYAYLTKTNFGTNFDYSVDKIYVAFTVSYQVYLCWAHQLKFMYMAYNICSWLLA